MPTDHKIKPHHTRFAPSPTGDLHIGHAFSALYAWQKAGYDSARFQLRIDDLDHTRCRAHFIDRQIDDLTWLGISWQAEPLRQTARMPRYHQALQYLQDTKLIYPCYLSRKEVDALLSAPQEAPALKHALSDKQTQDRHDKGTAPAWRLDMAKIASQCPKLSWVDIGHGTIQVDINHLGDAVIARRDIGASYDLSVVLDDFDSAISLVTRGADLRAQTNLHRLLQYLLEITPPLYDHHKLITDDEGHRLAKRSDSKSIATYRAQGWDVEDLKKLIKINE